MTVYPWLEAVESAFRERLKSGRVPHAMLLHGPAGTGKNELAMQMATALLCERQQWPACGECTSCRWMSTGAHPDFSFVSFEPNPRTGVLRKEIIVEQIRRLTSTLSLTATASPRKGAVLTPADAMNINAANALLKTLEEPQGQTALILVTDNPARLPATIRSRCQALSVRMPEHALALDWLVEAGGIDSSQAKEALDAAAGSPLLARQMAEDGGSEQFTLLAGQLERLRSGEDAPSTVLGEWLEADPVRLWTWISLHTAAAMRRTDMASDNAAGLARLQVQADRNRALMASQVRKDLLLQDWLIQWSELRL